VEFRPFCRADIPHMLSWFQTQAELTQWGGPKRRFPLDEAQMAALLAETAGMQPERRIWAGERQGSLVAMAGAVLDWDQGNALLTMVAVAPGARGHGLAAPFIRQVVQAVFREPAFERLELNVYTFNTAAIRTYDALGFVREGVRRSMARVGDERWDAAHYSILRSENRDSP
jgi:RimJ/RimL family protein N-acetyltransferase